MQVWVAPTGAHIATATNPENKTVTRVVAVDPATNGASFLCGNLNGSLQSWKVDSRATCMAETPANES